MLLCIKYILQGRRLSKIVAQSRLRKSYAIPRNASIGFNVKLICDLSSNGDRFCALPTSHS